MEAPIDCLIQGFSPRGFGLGSHSSIKGEIEIAHAIPGDRVRVSVKRLRKRVKKGKLLELLESSPDRSPPLCQHHSICGGCCWQAMAYAAQLVHKESSIQRAFQGLLQGVSIRPMIPCEQLSGYRNKMEFSFSENRAGEKFFGLMIAHAEPYVFNVQRCEIAPPWMSECLSRVRAWWKESGVPAYCPPRDEGCLRYLTLREAAYTGQRMAILNVASAPLSLDSFVEAVGPGISIFLRIHQAKQGVPTQFVEQLLAGEEYLIEEMHLRQGILRFKISPSSFFQTNTRQAEKLYDTALEFLGSNHTLVYDLYCGTGTIGIAAAAQSREVIGMELNPAAILDAQENARLNHLTNIQFQQGDIGRLLSSRTQVPDAVIVDPPRAGLDEQALTHLIQLKPKKLVYISCNPLTQAANLRVLIDAGFRLTQMQAVDLFPHTAHIENIALLLGPSSGTLGG